MNLSFLYPRFRLHRWFHIDYHAFFHQYPYAHVICSACAPKPDYRLYAPKKVHDYFTKVEMVRDILIVKKDRIITETRASVGVCSNCNIVLWATENLNWVLHLNPTQLQAVAYNLGAEQCSDLSSVCSPGIPGITVDTAVYVVGAPGLR